MECQDQILGGRSDEDVQILVRGRAVADHCPALLGFVQAALLEGARRVHVHLADCAYGDSTFVGTLLQLQRSTDAAAPEGFVLVSPSAELQQILATMGLTRLFRIETADGLPAVDWKVLATDRSNRHSFEFCHQIVAAHRELAESCRTRGELYRAVADDAERELLGRDHPES